MQVVYAHMFMKWLTNSNLEDFAFGSIEGADDHFTLVALYLIDHVIKRTRFEDALARPADVYYSCSRSERIHNTNIRELSLGFPFNLRADFRLLQFM